MRVTIELNWPKVLRWGLGLLFVWAALSKIADPQEFLGQLLSYRLPLPMLALQLTAATLPWLELLCGLLLLANYSTRAALTWSLALFAVFTLASGQAWARGLQIDCGCFNLSFLGLSPQGATSQFLHSIAFTFFRAIALGVISAYLLRRDVRNPETDGSSAVEPIQKSPAHTRTREFAG